MTIISYPTLYVKILNFTVWFLEYIKMHQSLLYIWSITNEGQFNRFILKIRKIFSRIPLFCVLNFNGVRFFFLFHITHSHKHSFYHNVIKAQWQRSLTVQLKWFEKSLQNQIIFICLLSIVSNSINNIKQKIIIKRINTTEAN